MNYIVVIININIIIIMKYYEFTIRNFIPPSIIIAHMITTCIDNCISSFN